MNKYLEGITRHQILYIDSVLKRSRLENSRRVLRNQKNEKEESFLRLHCFALPIITDLSRSQFQFA